MNRFFSLWTLLCVLAPAWAQAPAGYYEDATGTKGVALKTALYGIITDHTERSYANLWTDFLQTDVRDDGKVWDMYSSTTDFEFIDEQCGNYKVEGDCYNREHSFPKSWFNDASPMYTDLFHLYPTDGYVNNRRSNYPFGETNGGSYQSDGGFSKLGPSTVEGYTGTVFEPADEYKGDFARTYFYMATCYENRIASWHSDMLDGTSYPAFASWAVKMLLRWAAEDPVSSKEVARNNAVYRIQHNRNPYIDFPGLEQYVWGDKMDVAFDPDNYEGGEVTPPDADVADPTFNPAPGIVPSGTTVTISCTTEGVYIVYSLNGGGLRTEEAPVEVEITANTTIEAYAMKEDKTSNTVEAAYTLAGTGSEDGVQVFRKVTSTDDLRIGNRYLIVYEDEEENKAMGAISIDYRSACEVTITAGEIRTEIGETGLPFQVVLGGNPGAYTLYDAAAQAYLSLQSDGNKLHNAETAESENELWDITISGGVATLQSKAYTNRFIQYNASAPRFACYRSGQQPVSLYVNVTPSSISGTTAVPSNAPVDVYTADGRLVRRNVLPSQALKGLKKGLYIVKGNKVWVE